MNEFEAVAAFAVAAVVTLVTTPLTGRLAVRVGAIDMPRDRDLHESPVPRLGGLAILAGVLVSAVIFLPIDGQTRGILGGALLVTIVGAFDDLYDMPPRGQAHRADRGRRDPGGRRRARGVVHAAVRRVGGPGRRRAGGS